MKNRTISTKLAELLTIIDYCKTNSIEAIIMAVDFEKAFDTVNWNAMTVVMHAFGFDQPFIDMVMLCYRDFKVTIGNNRYYTKPLPLERGNKQGCPLSAFQFLLTVAR